MSIRRILFVCHGNICRSIMAHCLMAHLLSQAGMTDIEVDSAATSTEEIGNPIHYGAAAELRRHGIPLIPHRARQLRPEDAGKYDLFIGADSANLRNMARILGPENAPRCHLLLEFAGESRGIADPWYTDDFEETWRDTQKGCQALLLALRDDSIPN